MRIALALMLCLAAVPVSAAPREGRSPSETESRSAAVRDIYRSDTVVTIVTGGASSTDLAIAADLAEVLDGDDLRVLPIVGKGAMQSVTDVMFLRGVDMGITHANVLKHFVTTGELGPNLKNEIVYVAKLFNEEIHLVARDDIPDLRSLAGKSVSLGVEGSGGAITGRLLFESLGIDIVPLHLAEAEAIAKLKDREIDAAIVIGGKPAPAAATLRRADGLRLLPIAYPDALEDSYYPATLTHDDYPELIAEGDSVDTVSVCAVLISFNWPSDGARYRRVAKFIEAFFGAFDAFLLAPRHPKWREVNFAATLEGWQRSPAAQAWIDEARTRTEAASKRSFEAFLAKSAKDGGAGAPVSAAQRAELFRAFLEWNKDRKE